MSGNETIGMKGKTMSKFDSWVMDQQERAMEEAADRLKEEE